MKKIVLLLTVTIVMLSCSKVGKNEYLITGEAKGVANGKKVYLKQQNETGIIITADSAKVKDGKFEMKGKVTEPAMFAVAIEGLQQPVPIVLENGEIEVAIDKDSIWKSKIGGTSNNDEFQKFNNETNTIRKKLVDYQNKNMQKFMAARQKNDTVVANKLTKGFNVIQKELETYFKEYPAKNDDSYISLLLLNETFNAPDFNLEKVTKTFEDLDDDLKKTKIGKSIDAKLKSIKENSKKKMNPATQPQPQK